MERGWHGPVPATDDGTGGKEGQHIEDDEPMFIGGRKKGEEVRVNGGWQQWKGARLQWFFSLGSNEGEGGVGDGSGGDWRF